MAASAGPDPHPITGQSFTSPVQPGTGWPGDPAMPHTRSARSAAGVARAAIGARTLAELDARITVCHACPRLVAWREEVATSGRRAAFADQPYWGRPVPGFGDPAPAILVVGLAPAAHGANRTGRNFTGDRSGDWLFAALHRAGLASQAHSVHAGDGMELHGVRMIAPVRCAPPDNAPTPQERATCSAWFEQDLRLVSGAGSLRSILALGSVGWLTVLRAARAIGWAVPRPQPKFGHGAQALLARDGLDPVRLVGSYHVSQHNTFTGRLTEQMLDEVIGQL